MRACHGQRSQAQQLRVADTLLSSRSLATALQLVDPVTASQVVGAPELDGDAALEAAREAEMEELDPDERFGR